MTYENTMTMEAEGIYKKYDSKLQNCVMAETVEALKKSAAAADGLFRVSTTVKKGALPVAYMRLGDLLISAGVIRPEQLNDALAIQKKTRERLGDVLINNGIITEQQLIEALQMQLGVDFVDLTAVSIPLELARFVPRSIAKKYCVVPVKLQKDELYVAMSDPLNFEARLSQAGGAHDRHPPGRGAGHCHPLWQRGHCPGH